MTKEQYTKLNDLLNKADFDNLISTLATMTYLHNNYYNKADVDSKESALNSDIVLRELLANKATDFSVVDDTKYPTTKAVSERLLNLPIAELNNHTLREVFEDSEIIQQGFVQVDALSDNIIFQTPYNTNGGDKLYWRITHAGMTTNARNTIVTFGNVLDVQYGFENVIVDSGTYSDIFTTTISNTYIGWWINNPSNTVGFIDFKVYDLNALGISALTITEMDYWFSVYQALLVSDTNAIFSMFASKTLETWLTPTLTGANTTYLKYRKDTLGSVIVEGNITVTTAGTNLTLPVGYRPLFAYTVGILTFNTDGTVVSSATGTQSISVRFTGA